MQEVSAFRGSAFLAIARGTPPRILPHDTSMVPRDGNVHIHTVPTYRT